MATFRVAWKGLEPVRIAHLSSMRGCYGGEVHLQALAAGLRDRGHEVWGVVRPGSALAARLPAVGVPVVTLPLVDWFEPTGTWRLHRWLRRTGIEILHTHVPRDWYTAAVAAAGTGTVNLGTRHRLEPVGRPALKRPFVGGFAALLAVSEAVRAGLVAARLLPPERVLTVPNGVALPDAAVDRAALRARLGLDPAAPALACVGRLGPEKGVADLLAAAARLRPRLPDLQVLVIGDGGGDPRHPAELRAMAGAAGLAGAVRFLGYRDDAADLAAACDIQVVPSHAEPFGLVVLEALARGVPVVATRAGGVPEVVADGVHGVLVPPGDPEALAAALGGLLADPERRARLARAGRARVAAEFSLERMVSRTEEIYRRVLRARAPRFSPASAPRPAPRRR